jgi:hypothetical protein
MKLCPSSCERLDARLKSAFLLGFSTCYFIEGIRDRFASVLFQNGGYRFFAAGSLGSGFAGSCGA